MKYVRRFVNGSRVEVSEEVANACYLFSAKKLAKIERQVEASKLQGEAKKAYREYLIVPTQKNEDAFQWACVQEAKRQYEKEPTSDNYGLYSDLYKDYFGFRP